MAASARYAAAAVAFLVSALAVITGAQAASSTVQLVGYSDNGYATRVLVAVQGRSGGPYYKCSPCANGATATWSATNVPFATGDTLSIKFQWQSTGDAWNYFSSGCTATWDSMTKGTVTCRKTEAVGASSLAVSATLTTMSQWVAGRKCDSSSACASGTCLGGRCCASAVSAEACTECTSDGECVPPTCWAWVSGAGGILLAIAATIATLASACLALVADVDTELPDCDDLDCGGFIESLSEFVGLGTDSTSAAIYFSAIGFLAEGAAQTRGRAALGFAIAVVVGLVWWVGAQFMRLLKVIHKPTYAQAISEHKIKFGDCTAQCIGSCMCSPSMMIGVAALFNAITAVATLVSTTCWPLIVLRCNAAVQSVIGCLRLVFVTLPAYKKKQQAKQSYQSSVEKQDRVAQMKAKAKAKAEDEMKGEAMSRLEAALEDACARTQD